MAAAGTNLHVLTVIATGVIVAKRGVTAAGLQAGAAATSIGTAMQAAAIGDAVPVVALGTAVVEAGAAVAVGAALELNAAGQYITRSAGVTVGRALTAASGIGVEFEALLIPN